MSRTKTIKWRVLGGGTVHVHFSRPHRRYQVRHGGRTRGHTLGYIIFGVGSPGDAHGPADDRREGGCMSQTEDVEVYLEGPNKKETMQLPPNIVYGLRTLCHLAHFGKGVTADIACINQIPRRYLEEIIGKLRDAELVRGKRGRGGGYRLARPASAITVLEVVTLLKPELSCEGSGVERFVDHRLHSVLNGLTIASLELEARTTTGQT